MHSLFVGISGPSCSGKTTIISKLVEKIGESNAEVIHADDYWNRYFIPPLIEGFENRELPENLNLEKLYSHLQKLKQGDSVEVPFRVFFETENGKKIAKPKPVIMVEGFLLFYDKKISDLFDLKIYLDLEDEEIVRRRLERNRSVEKEREQYYRKVVVREYKKYGLPARRHAHLVLNAKDSVENNVKLIMAKIANFKSILE